MESMFGNEMVIVSAQPVAPEKPKMVIKNVAKLSDEALLKKLQDNKVDVPEGSTRSDLISLAKANGLWDYSGNILNAKKKAEYARKGGNCGDGVAQAFGTLTDSPEGLKVLMDVAGANGVDFSRWNHCNFGQKKMNLGNVLRGKVKRGEYVIIQLTEFNLPGEDEEAQG